MSQSHKKQWKNPTFRKKVSTSVRKAWTSPNLRKRQSIHSRKVWRSTELKRQASISSLKRWKSQKYKQQVSRLISKGLRKPEIIALLRKLRYGQVFPTEDTTPEKMMQKELRKRKIKFKKHVGLYGVCQPDIVFKKEKVAVFCDGEHWHNYPKGNTRDELQNELLRKEGWRVLRFWDYHQIRPNVDKCVDKIEKVLGSRR